MKEIACGWFTCAADQNQEKKKILITQSVIFITPNAIKTTVSPHATALFICMMNLKHSVTASS